MGISLKGKVGSILSSIVVTIERIKFDRTDTFLIITKKPLTPSYQLDNQDLE